jgi:hypothetical protein
MVPIPADPKSLSPRGFQPDLSGNHGFLSKSETNYAKMENKLVSR